MYIILHVWLLRKCNACENVELLLTSGMFAKLMWNCKIASRMQIVIKYAKANYFINVKWQNSFKVSNSFSTAESSSLCDPNWVSTGKAFTNSGGWYGNHFSGQRYAPTLNSGEARCAAPVARFTAGSTFAVHLSSLPNMLLPSACKRLPQGAP